MPLDATNMVANGHLIHQDIHQFVDLLTGVMADQPVVIANRLTVGGDLRFTPDITYDIGPSTFRPRSMYLGSFVQQGEIATPTPPPAGQMKIYPKSDGNYYKLDSAGVEQQIGAGGAGGGALKEDFLPPNGTNTVTVSQPPVAIWTVTRDGLTQTTTGGDWNVSGRVLTFSDVFNGSERVTVLYAISSVGAAGPTGPQGPSSSVHEEFLPAAAATTVVLSQTPLAILMCSRAGVVQSAADGNYSLSGNTITFTDPLNGAERIIVDYSSTSYTPALPLNGTSISDGTVTNAKLASDTARANLLTNGGLEIWQRETGPFSANGTYTADRWRMDIIGGTVTMDIHRIASTLSQGYSAYVAANLSGASPSLAFHQQIMPGDFLDSLKTRTLSFKVRAKSNTINTIHGWVQVMAPSLGGGLTRYSSPFNATTGGESHVVTFSVPSDATAVSAGVELANASSVCEVDDAMLVVGSQPADYAPLHPADDLARCLRYYEVMTPNTPMLVGQAINPTGAYVPYAFQVAKAVAPTVTVSAPATWCLSSAAATGAIVATGLTSTVLTVGSCLLGINVGAGLVAGNATVVQAQTAGQFANVEANP